MTSKGTDTAQQPYPECCMCGDCGFYDQLLRCKICRFRYQHSYCSNLYPKAKSYETCNICLSQNKVHVKEKSPNSSNSSSSHKNNGGANNDESKNKEIRSSGDPQNTGCKKGLIGSAKPFKKQRLPEAISPLTSVSIHKSIVTNEALEERVRGAKSVDIMNRNGVTKHVLRNKVRRYKLLDELSC